MDWVAGTVSEVRNFDQATRSFPKQPADSFEWMTLYSGLESSLQLIWCVVDTQGL
jgi:hypothetical protein